MDDNVTRRSALKVGIASAVLGVATGWKSEAAGAALAAKLNPPGGQGLHFKSSGHNKQNTFIVVGTGFNSLSDPEIALSGHDEHGKSVTFVTDSHPTRLSDTQLKVRTRVTKTKSA